MKFNRRNFIMTTGAGLLSLAMSPADGTRNSPVDKPNFIVIFTDDQGYQDLGCFGSPLIKTPHIDQMAAEGMKFTDFYTVSSVCTPARAGLLTGCYPPRVGVTGVLFPRNHNGLNPAEVNIANTLKQVGYATACVGKWHLGHLPKFLPENQGFDSYYGIPYSNDMWIDPNMEFAEDAVWRKGLTEDDLEEYKGKRDYVPLMRGHKVIEFPCDQRTLTKRYTEESLDFITRNSENPFFLYLAHTMPHVPLFASEKFEGRSERGLYGDTIEEIDWGVKQIIDRLQELGIDEKTLIVFTSDNGPWLGKRQDGGSALPLRGGKFTTWEGGFRVPTVMRWPGRIPAGRVCSEVAATIDLLPTFAALASVDLPEGHIVDGGDIWPLLSGATDAESPHELFYYYRNRNLEAARYGKWKYREGELYNLEDDIGEQHDLAQEFPELVEYIRSRMNAFDKKLSQNARPMGR